LCPGRKDFLLAPQQGEFFFANHLPGSDHLEQVTADLELEDDRSFIPVLDPVSLIVDDDFDPARHHMNDDLRIFRTRVLGHGPENEQAKDQGSDALGQAGQQTPVNHELLSSG
jgi:hypothetical protein